MTASAAERHRLTVPAVEVVRRLHRYVVMPVPPEGLIRRSYGIVDLMTCCSPRSLPWEHRPREFTWCGLPDESGQTVTLTWARAAEAEGWLHKCLAVRERQGGPAFFLPTGWYGPPETAFAVRTAFSPWQDHPAGFPLLRREGAT